MSKLVKIFLVNKPINYCCMAYNFYLKGKHKKHLSNLESYGFKRALLVNSLKYRKQNY